MHCEITNSMSDKALSTYSPLYSYTYCYNLVLRVLLKNELNFNFLNFNFRMASSKEIFVPSVTWAQRPKTVFITINVADVSDPDIQARTFGLVFSRYSDFT